MIYCEARLLRAGLANRLFPWARSRVYSKMHNVPALATSWAQIPFGAVLRGESDPRIYANLFEHGPNDITGWRRLLVRGTAARLAEPAHLSDAPPQHNGAGLLTFAGMHGQFRPLHGWHALLREELLAITRPQWRACADAIEGPYIGIHVRRGDFQRPAPGADLGTSDNMSTPISWFAETLAAVRAQQGLLPAVVTSDGNAQDLQPLLQMRDVRLVSAGSAIGDLLVLSRARLLLASGSSFSAWASFLGQMPTLSHPGQSLARLFGLTSGGPQHHVGEFDPSTQTMASLASTISSPPFSRAVGNA